MPKRLLQWLAVTSRKIRDAYDTKAYTWRMVLVPKPTFQSPLPGILVSLRNGHKKILLRVKSLEDYDRAFTLTAEEREKIRLALFEANREADRIEDDFRHLAEKRRQSSDADTGEVMAEAERIIREGKRRDETGI